MGTILRAAIAYVFLLLVLRVVGRRAVAQMTPFELILVFLLGGMTIQDVVTDDRSFTNALLGASTVAAMHIAVGALKQRSVTVRKIVDGTPVMLLQDGEWNRKEMHRTQILEEDVMAAAREKGAMRLDQVKHAIFERNGDITIVARE
jgi:uncharacterized membrane protein YcaP (DUF421 family)